MLVIRLQRNGRKSRAFYRLVVQDSRRTPTSGKVVALVGHYDPHSKDVVVNQERVQFFLDHGAQPSDRVISILEQQKIKLPGWVKKSKPKTRSIKHQEKLRKNQTQTTDEVTAESSAEETKETVEVSESSSVEE